MEAMPGEDVDRGQVVAMAEDVPALMAMKRAGRHLWDRGIHGRYGGAGWGMVDGDLVRDIREAARRYTTVVKEKGKDYKTSYSGAACEPYG